MTQIPDDVKDILRAAKIEEDCLTLAGQIADRKLYEATDRVLKALGIKWNRGRACHVFTKPNTKQLLDEALGSGAYVDEKKEFEVFETPDDVAADLARRVVKPGMLVLEPSAGSGRLVTAILNAGAGQVMAVEIRAVAELNSRGIE